MKKNTSELDVNLAPKNKNDNFIKLKKIIQKLKFLILVKYLLKVVNH